MSSRVRRSPNTSVERTSTRRSSPARLSPDDAIVEQRRPRVPVVADQEQIDPAQRTIHVVTWRTDSTPRRSAPGSSRGPATGTCAPCAALGHRHPIGKPAVLSFQLDHAQSLVPQDTRTRVPPVVHDIGSGAVDLVVEAGDFSQWRRGRRPRLPAAGKYSEGDRLLRLGQRNPGDDGGHRRLSTGKAMRSAPSCPRNAGRPVPARSSRRP